METVQVIGLIVWMQMQLGFEGGAGIVHRVPVRRDRPWTGITEKLGGERRQPGPGGAAGFYLRYFYHTGRFIESGGALRFYEVRVSGKRERFSAAMVPIRWGTRIDTTRWWVWGGLGASLLLRAVGEADPAQVYRFADYFSRSQLQLQTGVEWSLEKRWTVGVQVSWDLTSAWDRILFQDSRTFARHLLVTPYVRYAAWHLQ